jgi:hypothetical protein
MMGESGERERLCKQESRRKERKKEEGRDETVRLGLGDEREIRGTLYFFLGRARGAHRKDKTRQDRNDDHSAR